MMVMQENVEHSLVTWDQLKVQGEKTSKLCQWRDPVIVHKKSYICLNEKYDYGIFCLKITDILDT